MVLVVVGQQVPHGGERVPRPRDHVQQHRVADPETRRQRLRFGGDQPLEGGHSPGDESLGRPLADHPAPLLRVIAGLGQGALVLHYVLGRLHHHGAGGVVAGPAGPAGDLVELPRLQQPGLRPVVLGQGGEHYGADRNVDAHAQGVGPADDLQQAGLGQRLDQPSVLGQHARVVDANAVPHQAGQCLAEAGRKPEVADHLGDGVLVRAAADVDTHQRLGLLQRRRLSEVHDIGRRLVSAEQLLQGFVQWRGDVAEDQRDRALGGADHRSGPAGAPGQVRLEPAHIAQRRRHQDELRAGQLDQRHLPRPAPVRVGVVMELVHHHLADIGGGAVPQSDTGQHLRRAADNRRPGVDAGVPGHHADLGRAERLAEGEELLRHQGLDRRRVEGALTIGEGGEMRSGRDQALPGAGRGAQDHVRPRHDLDERFLLVRVEGQPLPLRPAGERVEDGVGIRRRGQQVGERHSDSIVPWPAAARAARPAAQGFTRGTTCASQPRFLPGPGRSMP